ncbi:MAG: hypothetical protein V1650_03120 [Candidatus Omnitrophota bacterium]
MLKKGVLVVVAVLAFASAYAQDGTEQAKEVSQDQVISVAVAPPATPAQGVAKDQVISIATAAVKEKGFAAEEAQIIYDDGNKLWLEQIGKIAGVDNSPNYGVLKRGFLKNYYTVYFDFKEPLKDVWVFIDKDTGEVSEVYQEQ